MERHDLCASVDRRTARRVVAVLAFAVVFGCPPRVAWGQFEEPFLPSRLSEAEQEAEVRDLMQKGIAEYQRQNLEAARQAFMSAWYIRRYRDLAGTLAEIEMKLGRYREAAEHLQYYLDQGPPDPDDAAAKLEECRRKLGRIRVTVDTPKAWVWVDQRIVGPAPIGDLWLEPGRHWFYARLDGRQSAEEAITVVAGETHDLRLSLPRAEPPAQPATPAPTAAAPARAPAPEPTSDDGGMRLRTVALIGGAVVSATAAGIAVGFALKGAAADDEADKLREQTQREGDQALVAVNRQCSPSAMPRPASCDELGAKLDERVSANKTANAALWVAGISGVVTIATFFLWPSEKREPAKSGAVVVEPWTQPGVPGIQARASF
jgi:tetratricopeptide (TPR) repeat protein